MRSLGVFALLLAGVLFSPRAEAQNRLIEIEFTPTERAQIAVWIETPEGEFLQTLKLTESVARRGVGNRPGAMQMNSGFHWPYGRREGVLPVWAHRRLNADGARPFQRVIFQNRNSEGFASRTSSDASPDDYYCLSFNNDASSLDNLDAVTCPSQFNSDKGRYLTDEDVTAGYAEPFETEGGMTTDMRAMDTNSLYPPRRDLPGLRGSDHPDSAEFDRDARGVMPEIDAVTMATLPADQRRTLQITLPEEFEMGEYVIFVEVNVEGDYGEGWGPERFPTPVLGDRWDFWAQSYGYPYRGMPSIVYRLPFQLNGDGGTFATDEAFGYGDIHGATGEITPLDASITDDPTGAPGSGADRLLGGTDSRLSVVVIPNNVCNGDDPPPQCFSACSADNPCDVGFICNIGGECVGRCDEEMPPSPIGDLVAEVDEERSWQYAHFSFTAPTTGRNLRAYQIRVHTEPFEAGMNFAAWGTEAKVASLEDVALVVSADGAAGTFVEASLGHLIPETTYYIGVRAVDDCFDASEVASAEVRTTEIIFTTVSPCFVATAAYGSPMASEIGALRRFRDRHLMTSGVGRTLVEAYYEVGPALAELIREDENSKIVVRRMLAPVIDLVRWLDT